MLFLLACYACYPRFYFFFFFQAEDGIRDVAVTGVQTCALPIWIARILVPATSCPFISEMSHSTYCVAKVSSRSAGDRKSTRLNSSHGYISYAVFCLKKKKKDKHTPRARSTPAKYVVHQATFKVV